MYKIIQKSPQGIVESFVHTTREEAYARFQNLMDKSTKEAIDVLKKRAEAKKQEFEEWGEVSHLGNSYFIRYM